MGGVLDLVKHLKQSHWCRKIIFQCSKCGRENEKHLSIACHIPYCKGKPDHVTPSGNWTCEVCGMDFQSQSGLSQHKRLSHPAVRNNERIAATLSKRGQHFKCWTPEEVDVMKQLLQQHGTNKHVNKIIAEHIPTKTLKQISDKKHSLLKAEAGKGLQRENIQIIEELKRPTKGETSGDDQLRSHYFKKIKEGLTSRKITHYRRAFKRILKGKRDPLSVIGEATEKCYGCLSMMCQIGKTSATKKQRRNRKPKKASDGKQQWMRKRAIKRGHFLRFQDLFYKDRGKLARIILDDLESMQCEIPLQELYSVFQSRWETPGSFKSLGSFKSAGLADNKAFYTMITEKEVEKNAKEMSKNSAPGPDGVTLNDLRKMDPKFSQTAEIFNLWLTSGKIPDMVRDCRTVVIPKTTIPERLKNINNWRPITIGSILLRLFSRVITARLSKACPINPRQRGFIRAPGCSENLKLLQLLIRHAKREHRELGVVFVDIAKAFDTVGHQHIIMALKQRGVDSHIVGLIDNMYENICTRITSKEGETEPIRIKVGVKQGDPMSPLLFNLALDPLLCKLEEIGCGFQKNKETITAMAFADDLVLLSGSWEGMMKNISILETFCDLTGLKTQGEKCHGFYIKPTEDSYTINNCPAWTINGTPLNMIHPGSSEKYLGLQVDPWTGIKKPEIMAKLQFWLDRISSAPLKPLQKLNILRVYTIPRLIYIADHAEVKTSLLESLDKTIRSTVKEWLHLPPCTCDAILYSSTKDGGLGLLRLTALIPSIQARRLHRLAQSSDEVIKAILREEHIEDLYKKLWMKAGGDKNKLPSIWEPRPKVDPLLEDETNEWEISTFKPSYPRPCDWRKAEFQRWKTLGPQGVGIENFEGDNISNAWIERHRGIPHRKLITALQLRANVYPHREFLSRGQKGSCNKTCRQCKAEVESSSHIIGQCPSVQDARIKRHNYICQKLSTEAQKKKWVVFQEPRLRDENNVLFKPDLILVREDQAYVVDVTVRYGFNTTYLDEAAMEKVAKYQPLLQQIQDLTNTTNIKFVGFPLGSRGKWHQKNFELFNALGFSSSRQKRLARTLASRALFSSVDMIHMFASKSHATDITNRSGKVGVT
ncbi:hypothetical protein WISP_01485 [Willisornis vidua]|uniref:Uncharacterized protein n=1 Tax=Willisornis vidua TaxID=1566151 RepID=A0ABQ9DZN8_9PASS|nr:hypothetical protein WISP_01485 [Willisornis vidua]